MTSELKQFYSLAELEYPSNIEDKELLASDSSESYINRYEHFLDTAYLHLGLAELEEKLDIEATESILKERFYNDELAGLLYRFTLKGETILEKLTYFSNPDYKSFPKILRDTNKSFEISALPSYGQYQSLKSIKDYTDFEFGYKNTRMVVNLKKRHAESIGHDFGFDEKGYIKFIESNIIRFRENISYAFKFLSSLIEMEEKGAISICNDRLSNVYYKLKPYIKELSLDNLLHKFSLYRFKLIYLNTIIKAHNKHIYIVAGTGGGKSELIKYIFAQEHLKQKKSLILIDPHGDLAEQIAKARVLNNSIKARNLIYFDCDFKNTIKKAFYGKGKDNLFKENKYFSNLPTINPLELPEKYKNDTRVIENTAKNILNAFEEIIRSDGDESGAFSRNMETLLIPCLSALLRKNNSSLFDLQDFMDDELNKPLVDFGIKNCSAGQKRFFEKNFYNKQLEKTKHAIYMKLQAFFNSELFTSILCGKSTIDLEQAQKEDCKIIFRLDKKTTGSMQTAIGTFITTSILNASYRLTESQRRGTYFIIDEFQNFVTDSIAESLSESRKYGLNLILAHQSSNQIRDSKVKASVSANTDIKILGKSESDTHSFFSKKATLSNELKEKAKNLKAGQFYLFNGYNSGTLFKAPSMLIKTKQLDSEEWSSFLVSQYEAYYKPRKNAEKEKEERAKKIKKIKYTEF